MASTHAEFVAEADRAHELAQRTANPAVREQWLRIEARYRALAQDALAPAPAESAPPAAGASNDQQRQQQ
jgi:hypothetical protein